MLRPNVNARDYATVLTAENCLLLVCSDKVRRNLELCQRLGYFIAASGKSVGWCSSVNTVCQ